MTKKLKPLTVETAPSGSREILQNIQKGMGFVPNLFATFAHNAEVLKSYLALSDAFGKSGFSPLEQQVVAFTVSTENGCHYCVAAHTAISKMGHLDETVIGALRTGDALSDTKLEALRTFTKRVVSSKGWPDRSDIEAFYKAGYAEKDILAVILGVSMKTLSNYVNHVAETPLDDGFKPFAWKRLE